MFIRREVNKIYLLLFLVSVGISDSCFAQKQVIQGKITNEKEVEGIHILNTTSRYNAVTNENGNFSINVNRQDTLVFSSVNYFPKKVFITDEIYEKGVLTLELIELVNQLDEVVLGPNLTGNIATDVENIKTEKDLNFDDVGIPGFKGQGEEKIVPVVVAFFPTNVNIEAVYKYISGYYKKLKLQRKWEAQNNSVAHLINLYSVEFFNEAYSIPQDRVYDFILFCIETTSLQNDFKNDRFNNVLEIFKTKSEIYILRLEENKE
jgi:hypothetical protein